MYLEKIVHTKHKEVERLKENFSLNKAEAQIAAMPHCLGFSSALSERKKRGMGLIAEVKKASPSKGLIRPDFDPVSIAKSYEEAGTDCISVLTDIDYFQGSNDYLRAIRGHVKVPLLRKDFTIDYRQIYEARLIGADAVLLIAAILTREQMREYADTAQSLGMDALIEVHDREELERVLELDAKLLGINNRNLRTFVTDIKTTEQLLQYIPKETVVVSESGISRAEEIEYLKSLGVSAVLIGEHFMRQTSVGGAVRQLLGEADPVPSDQSQAEAST